MKQVYSTVGLSISVSCQWKILIEGGFTRKVMERRAIDYNCRGIYQECGCISAERFNPAVAIEMNWNLNLLDG